jgi:hypothetical protein
MDIQKRIKQCERCGNRIKTRINNGTITVDGLKAALFNLSRHIAYLEKESTEKGATKAISNAEELLNSSEIKDIIDGKKPIIKKSGKTTLNDSKKKKHTNIQARYMEWRDKVSLEGYYVPGTASEQIRYTKGFKKGSSLF